MSFANVVLSAAMYGISMYVIDFGDFWSDWVIFNALLIRPSNVDVVAEVVDVVDVVVEVNVALAVVVGA